MQSYERLIGEPSHQSVQCPQHRNVTINPEETGNTVGAPRHPRWPRGARSRAVIENGDLSLLVWRRLFGLQCTHDVAETSDHKGDE
jgi:hypothetical protein